MATSSKLSSWGVIISSALVCFFLMLSCSAQDKGGTGKAAAGKSGGGGSTGNAGAGGSSGSGGSQYSGGGGGSTGGKAGAGTGGTGGDCAGVNVQASRIKPWILFVVDRSGSTADAYPGSSSKWQALYDTLMTPNTGVITKLDSVAFFGMVLYHSGNYATSWICILVPTDPSCTDGGVSACPSLVTVAPALNNAAPIDAAYMPSGPGSGTPTALALQAGYKLVPPQQQILDQEIGPQFVILATDGLPNGCGADMLGNTEQGVIDQVTAGAAAGIKTYVVSTAVDQAAQAHMEQVALAGNTGSPAFSPATKDDLVSIISQIVGGAIGCKVKLNGTVTAGQDPCKGHVSLNSRPLTCNDPDGWKLADESHIELQGKACDEFLNNPTALLSAGFPCGVFILQ